MDPRSAWGEGDGAGEPGTAPTPPTSLDDSVPVMNAGASGGDRPNTAPHSRPNSGDSTTRPGTAPDKEQRLFTPPPLATGTLTESGEVETFSTPAAPPGGWAGRIEGANEGDAVPVSIPEPQTPAPAVPPRDGGAEGLLSAQRPPAPSASVPTAEGEDPATAVVAPPQTEEDVRIETQELADLLLATDADCETVAMDDELLPVVVARPTITARGLEDRKQAALARRKEREREPEPEPAVDLVGVGGGEGDRPRRPPSRVKEKKRRGSMKVKRRTRGVSPPRVEDDDEASGSEGTALLGSRGEHGRRKSAERGRHSSSRRSARGSAASVSSGYGTPAGQAHGREAGDEDSGTDPEAVNVFATPLAILNGTKGGRRKRSSRASNTSGRRRGTAGSSAVVVGGAEEMMELQSALRRALKSQRDSEVRLQLELQKKVQLEGSASRLLHENEMLKTQVEDIRGRLLEAKLQNVRLKNELQSRQEALQGSLAAKCKRLNKCCGTLLRSCKDESKEGRREGRELCLVILALVVLVVGLIIFFATLLN
eukprot:SAG11_NODE_108_length_16386_cov_20.828329_2_plen_540_part_00